MVADWRIAWNEAELLAVAHAEFVRSEVAVVGARVAAAAKASAPRSPRHRGSSPGHAADSIHAETVLEHGEWVARVSWDQLHAYFRFPNRRTHFLEHAADRYAR